jgi:hypothetical protein
MLNAVLTAIQIYTREGDLSYTVLYQHPDYIVIKTKEDKTALIFYGTDSIMEWADNFRYGILSTDSFPKGWYSAAISAHECMAKNKFVLDYVIGYSRGAAIAIIYSYYFKVQAVGISTPNISKKLLYWALAPVLICSLNDPIRLIPIGYRAPGNYIAIFISAGGHFWTPGKFTTEVKKHLVNK